MELKKILKNSTCHWYSEDYQRLFVVYNIDNSPVQKEYIRCLSWWEAR